MGTSDLISLVICTIISVALIELYRPLLLPRFYLWLRFKIANQQDTD